MIGKGGLNAPTESPGIGLNPLSGFTDFADATASAALNPRFFALYAGALGNLPVAVSAARGGNGC